MIPKVTVAPGVVAIKDIVSSTSLHPVSMATFPWKEHRWSLPQVYPAIVEQSASELQPQ